VVEVLVEEGMNVEENQILARIDPATVEAELGLARAQLEASRRALEETRVRLEEARVNLTRLEDLTARGVAAEADLDAARAEVDSLAARLARQRSEVTVTERQLALRRQDREDMVIRAPFAGVVVSKDAQPGEMISPVSAGGGFTRTGICTLVDMSSLEIEVDVAESYINRVEPAQPVAATLDAYPNWQVPGRVIAIVPTADRQKATVKVRIAFDELDPRILPDMGVKVAFLEEPGTAEGPGSASLLVPREALRGDGGQDVVLVVRDGRAERRAVTVREAGGGRVEVVSGLTAGERVVVEGPTELADGDAVREVSP
jgi:RND family efflux transporter MFP subunit